MEDNFEDEDEEFDESEDNGKTYGLRHRCGGILLLCGQNCILLVLYISSSLVEMSLRTINQVYSLCVIWLFLVSGNWN